MGTESTGCLLHPLHASHAMRGNLRDTVGLALLLLLLLLVPLRFPPAVLLRVAIGRNPSHKPITSKH